MICVHLFCGFGTLVCFVVGFCNFGGGFSWMFSLYCVWVGNHLQPINNIYFAYKKHLSHKNVEIKWHSRGVN